MITSNYIFAIVDNGSLISRHRSAKAALRAWKRANTWLSSIRRLRGDGTLGPLTPESNLYEQDLIECGDWAGQEYALRQ